MPSEVARCIDCNAPLKGVPSWLATADVKFTCSNCPKRPSRAARYEAVSEPRPILSDDEEPSIAAGELEDIDEEADLEIAVDDIDESKEDI